MIYDLHEVDRQLQSDAPGAISAWERHYSDQIARVAELVVKNRGVHSIDPKAYISITEVADIFGANNNKE